jgi:hypothetical protein
MPQPPNKDRLKPTGASRLALLLVLLVWLAILGLAAVNRQNILDWWQLRNYQPPPAVAQLAGQDTMTPYARKVFYVNKPAIDDRQQFSKVCPNNGGEQTIVLGCYHSYQAGIFLFGVSDPRLNGVEQVTAAHEMLHAAYDRLSGAERQRVNAMLLDYYNHGLHDQRILTTIAAYKKTEPHDLVNEMHSVFGTEVANLPSGLEQYYQRYFTNRAQIAGYAAQYQAEFTSRQTAVTQDDTQLASLKARIDALEANLKAQQGTISAQQATLMAERNAGNIGAYNAGVPTYNAQVDAYNAGVQTVQDLVNRYNQLVANRNAIALQESQLVNELSNSATPISR